MNQVQEEDLMRLKAFCLMDDEFMTACFDGDIRSVQLILRIILCKEDLKVEDVRVQYLVKNLQRRSVKLDIFATDSEGRKFDIEIQRADKGAGFKRARYNSSLIDAKVLEPGNDFENLPETYVIFITENDVIGKGEPLYHINRYIEETKGIFDDKAHIIYVNGSYRGDTPLGHLMEDFHCTDPSKMYYNELKERVRYFKETKEGTATMGRISDELREEGKQVGDAARLTKSIEQIMKNLSLDLTEACRALGITPEEYERAKALK